VRISLHTSFILNRGGTPELRNSSCSELQAFVKATFFLSSERRSQNLNSSWFLYLRLDYIQYMNAVDPRSDTSFAGVNEASLRRWAAEVGMAS
jgi:hypothetical protein